MDSKETISNKEVFTGKHRNVNRNVKGHLLVIVKDQSSHLVYIIIMHKITNLCNFDSIGRRCCEKKMEGKKTFSHKVCAFKL